MSQGFRMMRRYVGGLQAAILDWSGTTADKYVLAPAVVFVDVFEKHKVPISMKEARLPMGLRKDLHIKAITEQPEVRERWREVYGKYPDQDYLVYPNDQRFRRTNTGLCNMLPSLEGDVDNMFRDFVPMQLGCLQRYTDLLPGTAQTVDTLRNDFGMKIGCTTGFLRSMVDVLLEDAKKQGYVPDVSVAGDEVVNGARPKPHMVYKNLDLMDIQPIQAVVKVDDTVSGIGEALNAGCWGVGVAKYSNYMDINSLEHEATLDSAEMQRRLEISRDMLRKAGAHYVIDSLVELPEVCSDINTRLSRGEQP